MIVLPFGVPAHGFGASVFIELVEEVLEPVGDALAQYLVVNALKDVTEPSLVLAAEAPPSLSHWRVGMHHRLCPRGLLLHRVRPGSLFPGGRLNRLAFVHLLSPGEIPVPGPLKCFIAR